ncbi:MAG TPA: hypothetical protein VGH77_24990 [Streptosporangiaceae bacterium]|jgi:hypothetical protein
MIRIRRFAACLAAMLAALAASALAAPAAFAMIAPPDPAGAQPIPLTKQPASVHTVVVGGMPGWQIALIAAGAAVLAAALAVAVDRLLSARRADATRVGHRPARLGSGTAA